jgi:hypothetical protein
MLVDLVQLAAEATWRAAAALPVPPWLLDVGAGGLVVLVVLLILVGRLVPRRTFEDVQRERDQWRDVALRAMGHTDVLLPAAQITTEVARALQDQAAPAAPDQGAAG